MPGGRDVLVEIRRGSGGLETAGIAVVSLDTGKATIIADKGTDPSYAPTGHIIYARDNSLEAVPFDPQRLERSGPAVQLGREVAVDANRGGGDAHYTFSQSGQLVYVRAGARAVDIRRQMVWVDRQGNETLVGAPERNFAAVRLSPEGSRIAVEVFEGGGPPPNRIWLFGIEDGTWGRLTVEGASSPVWTLDGKRLLYASSQGGIYSKAVNFIGEQQRILQTRYPALPTSIAKSGELLLHEMVEGSRAQRRILVMPMNGDSTAYSPLRDSGEFNQRGAMASPDGRWVAYVDKLSDRDEVYVRSFPDFGERHQISVAGGRSPTWGGDETELFYVAGKRMIVARVQTEPEFDVVERVPLFENPYLDFSARTAYDYDRRNDRFLMVKTIPLEVDPNQYTVVFNWFEELRQLAPRGR